MSERHNQPTKAWGPDPIDEPLPPYYQWKGEGPPPTFWYAPDGTRVYRSYADYCDD